MLPSSVRLELMPQLIENGARQVYVDGGKTIQGFLLAD
jgi:hypothetical protein